LSYNFPGTPTDGQIFQPANGPAYIWSAALNAWNPANVSGVTYATAAELLAAIDTGITIDPKTLGEDSVASSAGAADASKWVRLNANGIVDPTMLPQGQNILFATTQDVMDGTDQTKAISPNAIFSASAVRSSGATDSGKYVRLSIDGKLDASMYDSGTPTFADAAEINTGTEAAKSIAPDQLRAASITTSAGSADANKYPRLNANGKIDDTMLRDALVKATSAEIIAGANDTKFITALGLRGATIQSGSTAAAANKIPRLNAVGKIDGSMLPAAVSQFKGTIAPTATPAANPATGDYYYVSVAGKLGTGWGALATTVVKANDQLIYNGTAWNLISNSVDLTGYLPLTGSPDMTGAIGWNLAQTGEVMNTNGGYISAVVDAGSF
jgi:hypothetical protein